jgi:hypothetical protein
MPLAWDDPPRAGVTLAAWIIPSLRKVSEACRMGADPVFRVPDSIFLTLVIFVASSMAFGSNVVGVVKAGATPISGATVKLYDAAHDRHLQATLLGSASTDSDGHFSITYDSRPPTDVIYLIASGSAASLEFAAVLGQAGGAPSNVVINELTTIASAWSMAQFLDGDSIGGKSPGMPNAAATSGILVDVLAGTIATLLGTYPNGSSTSTMAEFNSLGNLLAACASGNQSNCTQLFNLATPPGGAAPSNTLQAALNIAHYPWQNVPGLFSLAQNSTDYIPALSSAPDAWTVAIRHYGNGHEMNGPGAMSFDVNGNVWVVNNYDLSVARACSGRVLTELTPIGADAPGAPFTGGGINGPGYGVTIDPSGHIWLGNFGFRGSACPIDNVLPANSVSEFTPDGVALSPSQGFTGDGHIQRPQGMASDPAGNIWIANFTDKIAAPPGRVNYITEIVAGDPSNVKTFINNDILGQAFDVAVDGQGSVWATSTMGGGGGGGTIVGQLFKVNPNDGTYQRVTNSNMTVPHTVAIDSLGNAWVTDLVGISPVGKGNVVAFGNNGNPLSDHGFTGGGIVGPWGVAIDGNDNVWIADFFGAHLDELCGARPVNCPPGYHTGDPISPSTGYTSNAMVRLTQPAIDGSGNVWVTNNWRIIPYQMNPGGVGLVEFIGLAAPIKMPLIGPPQQP